jgi:hypothetical protein
VNNIELLFPSDHDKYLVAKQVKSSKRDYNQRRCVAYCDNERVPYRFSDSSKRQSKITTSSPERITRIITRSISFDRMFYKSPVPYRCSDMVVLVCIILLKR